MSEEKEQLDQLQLSKVCGCIVGTIGSHNSIITYVTASEILACLWRSRSTMLLAVVTVVIVVLE